MTRPLNLIAALAAGAALMFYLDPKQGRRRRTLVRDKSVSLSHRAKDYAEAKRTHFDNRLKGLSAESRMRTAAAVDDDLLREQIRAKAHALLSNPLDVEIQVDAGVVRLSGHAAPDEHEALVTRVAAMRGVVDIEDELEAAPDSVASDEAIELRDAAH